MPLHDALGDGIGPMLPIIWLALMAFIRVAVVRAPARVWPPAGTANRTEDRPQAMTRSETLRERWETARRRYHTTAEEFTAYECDPGEVLRLPALADPEVPATARFIAAFHEAMALHTDEFPPPSMAERFITAANSAAQAWHAANAAAEKLRASRFTPEERAMISQGIKLLELADLAATPAEQDAAYRAARQVLTRLEHSTAKRMEWRLPRRARAEIQRHTSELLPADAPRRTRPPTATFSPDVDPSAN